MNKTNDNPQLLFKVHADITKNIEQAHKDILQLLEMQKHIYGEGYQKWITEGIKEKNKYIQICREALQVVTERLAVLEK